uniref:uncharacterized protein LOC114670532 isoform X1 n=1 Tax=Macaca mulatta TaxID=9544 RepID=UPI0010A27714|nr:uncharacterized protein LOC114670532 isoform X1 [Macaca mulatta]
MGNRFSCFQGDSKKPSKKHVKREPCSTTTVTSSSTINEILRRYSLYTTQRWRHHGFWGRKKVHPQEDCYEHEIPKYCEPWPSLEGKGRLLARLASGLGCVCFLLWENIHNTIFII